MNTNQWGKQPENIRQELRQKYWVSTAKRRSLLRGDIAFPLQISLKPPTGAQALRDLETYRQFVHAWKAFRQPENVIWQSKNWQQFGEQTIPCFIQINNLDELIDWLGERKTIQHWQHILNILLFRLSETLRDTFIHHMETLAQLSDVQLTMFINVLLQLQPNLGQGNYLRALPIKGAHSKFIEQHASLLENIATAWHGEIVRQQGLSAWLGCLKPPKDWLIVRPLCAQTQCAISPLNLPIMRLDTQTLLQTPLPSTHILVVENDQAALALPELPDTIAVAGGGYNTAWLAAPWLPEKNMAYWGDLDEDGLTILSQARAHLPDLPSMMMQPEIIDLFSDFLTTDTRNSLPEPANLTLTERATWQRLHAHTPNLRLEQEYLAADFVAAELAKWISGSLKIQ